MPDPASLRDSTQIVLPCEVVGSVREDLESEFTLTIVEDGGSCRIVGSPVAIKDASEFLVQRGVSVP